MATTFPSSSAANASQDKLSAQTKASNHQHVTKRLQSELMEIMMQPPAGVSAFPVDDSSMTSWTGHICGVEGTVYQGLKYKIHIDFPASYPYSPPNVKFTSTIFHPNVALQGDICLDILQKMWSPAISVSNLLLSLQSLLNEPNNESPLNVEAAELWDNQAEFKKKVMAHYTPVVEEDDW